MKTKIKLLFVSTLLLLAIASGSVFAIDIPDFHFSEPIIPHINFGLLSIVMVPLLVLALLFNNMLNMLICGVKGKKDIKNFVIYNIAFHLPFSLLVLLTFPLIDEQTYGLETRIVVITIITIIFAIIKAICDTRFINKIFENNKIRPLIYSISTNILPLLLFGILAICYFNGVFVIVTQNMLHPLNVFFVAFLIPITSIIFSWFKSIQEGEKVSIISKLISLVISISIFFYFFEEIYYFGFEPLAWLYFFGIILLVAGIKSIPEAFKAKKSYNQVFLRNLLFIFLYAVFTYLIYYFSVCIADLIGGMYVY